MVRALDFALTQDCSAAGRRGQEDDGDGSIPRQVNSVEPENLFVGDDIVPRIDDCARRTHRGGASNNQV